VRNGKRGFPLRKNLESERKAKEQNHVHGGTKETGYRRGKKEIHWRKTA